MNFWRWSILSLRTVLWLPAILCWLPKAKSDFQPLSSLYAYKLESLRDFSSIDTSQLRGLPSIWIVFQASCSSCTSQLKSLQCLPAELRVVALGLGGNNEALRKTLRQTSFLGMSLSISPRLADQIEVSGTPTTLFVDQQGTIQTRLTGLRDCAEIQRQLSKLNLLPPSTTSNLNKPPEEK